MQGQKLLWLLLRGFDLFGSRGVRIVQELGDAINFVSFTNGGSCSTERVECAQETAVWFMRPWDRTGTLPTGTAQGIETAVVANASISIGFQRAAVVPGIFGGHGPGP